MGLGERFWAHRGGDGELFYPIDVPHAGCLTQRLLRLERSAVVAEEPRRRCPHREDPRDPPQEPRDLRLAKVHAELRAIGIHCSRMRVAKLMRNEGLKGCLRGRKKRTTRRDGSTVAAPDLIRRNFAAVAPDRLWVADITYVRSDEEGFLYLAFVLDAYSRRLVGWTVATHLRSELVIDTLQMAIWRRRPSAGLIYHSDQGV